MSTKKSPLRAMLRNLQTALAEAERIEAESGFGIDALRAYSRAHRLGDEMKQALSRRCDFVAGRIPPAVLRAAAAEGVTKS